MSTLEHVPAAALLDYYLGDPGVDEVEGHLFECAECSAKLEELHRTAAVIVEIVRAGELSSGATTGLLNRMSRDRLNVRHYAIEPGETVACTVAAADDFMAGHFILPEGDFERLDLCVLDSSDRERARVDDIVIEARYRRAIVCIPARPVLDEGSGTTQYVLVVQTPSGERELARYSMAHIALRDGLSGGEPPSV